MAKNFFIFAPLIFSHHLLDFEKVKIEFIAFLSFSLVASSIYVINDIADRESDRAHPVKRNRPIASGRVKVWIFFLLLLQDRHCDLSKIIHHKIIHRSFCDLMDWGFKPIPPKSLPRCDSYFFLHFTNVNFFKILSPKI